MKKQQKNKKVRPGQRSQNPQLQRINQRALQVPTSTVVTLNYGAQFTVSSALGAPGYYNFRADCFDPDVTSAGSQPIGFDQWMAFYEKYRVLRFRAHVVPTNLSNLQYFAGCATSTGATLAATEDAATVAAMPFGKLVIAGATQPFPALDSGWLNVWDVLGQSRQEYMANENAVGTAAAIATISAWWQIVGESTTAVNTASENIINLSMDVEFFDRTKLVNS